MDKKGKVTSEDELDLYDCWKTILRRKKLVIGLFLITVVTVAVISLLMPKTYRGEVVLKIIPKEVKISKEGSSEMIKAKEAISAKELVNVIGELNDEKITMIFTKDPSSIDSIKMEEIKGSTDMIKVSIESKINGGIQNSFVEFVEYINNFPLMKHFVEQEKSMLSKQLEELSLLIRQSDALARISINMVKKGRLGPVGFNPVEMNQKVYEMKIEEVVLEQTSQNLTGVVMVSQPFVSKNPVKPHVKLYIAVAGILSILTGIILAFFIEYIEKIKYKNKKNTD